MGKKWVKVDPAEIKVGDRVKVEYHGAGTVIGTVHRCDSYACISLGDGFYRNASPSFDDRTWYVRKPKPAKDTYYAELEAEVKELKAERDETQAQLDDAMLTIAEQRTELANLRKVLAEVQNAATPTPTADRYDGHGVEYWYNRYARQLAHSKHVEAMNSKRRQKMQLLKKEAKDARADSDYWRGKYAEAAVALNELPDEPTPPAPLTRPDEPLVGTFFRVDRTGNVYLRRVCQGRDCVSDYLLVKGYHNGLGPSCTGHWYDFTEPGDTIILLELTEVGDKRDADA